MARRSDRLIEASHNISRGNASFHVLMAGPAISGKIRQYIIAVPKALMRSGFTGWISEAIICTSGTATAFGDDIFDSLNAFQGVEAGLNNQWPHVLMVHVDNDYDGQSSGAGFRHQSHGLPQVVCVAIEAAILRNNRWTQRFAEWLRRLF